MFVVTERDFFRVDFARDRIVDAERPGRDDKLVICILDVIALDADARDAVSVILLRFAKLGGDRGMVV